jgi:hypothetical protein
MGAQPTFSLPPSTLAWHIIILILPDKEFFLMAENHQERAKNCQEYTNRHSS